MLYIDPLSSPMARMEGSAADQLARKRTAFRELEQYFIKQLLKEMRASVKHEGIFKGGPEQQHFEEMRDDAMSAEMARSGQFGIARMLEEQLKIGELNKQLHRDPVTGRIQRDENGKPLTVTTEEQKLK